MRFNAVFQNFPNMVKKWKTAPSSRAQICKNIFQKPIDKSLQICYNNNTPKGKREKKMKTIKKLKKDIINCGFGTMEQLDNLTPIGLIWVYIKAKHMFRIVESIEFAISKEGK